MVVNSEDFVMIVIQNGCDTDGDVVPEGIMNGLKVND